MLQLPYFPNLCTLYATIVDGAVPFTADFILAILNYLFSGMFRVFKCFCFIPIIY